MQVHYLLIFLMQQYMTNVTELLVPLKLANHHQINGFILCKSECFVD